MQPKEYLAGLRDDEKRDIGIQPKGRPRDGEMKEIKCGTGKITFT
jgi:hypothetical protein